MIALGTCSKFPTKLCGRRVRVLPCERRGDWPRPGETGMLYSVSGPFVLPHDGLEECECVHVATDSGFDVRFDDGQTWSGYPPHALELVECGKYLGVGHGNCNLAKQHTGRCHVRKRA